VTTKPVTKPVTVTLARGAAKVNSVRFDAPVPDKGGAKPALSAIYLHNAADEALGSPPFVTVTIEAAP